MAEFKVIETQEEFDSAIQKRLAHKEREVSERFKGYLSPDDVKALTADYDGKLSKAQTDLEAMGRHHPLRQSDVLSRPTTSRYYVGCGA